MVIASLYGTFFRRQTRAQPSACMFSFNCLPDSEADTVIIRVFLTEKGAELQRSEATFPRSHSQSRWKQNAGDLNPGTARAENHISPLAPGPALAQQLGQGHDPPSAARRAGLEVT